jgi:hypothetical protein
MATVFHEWVLATEAPKIFFHASHGIFSRPNARDFVQRTSNRAARSRSGRDTTCGKAIPTRSGAKFPNGLQPLPELQTRLNRFTQIIGKTRSAEAIRRKTSCRKWIKRFIKDGRLEIRNNAAVEWAMRQIALGQHK